MSNVISESLRIACDLAADRIKADINATGFRIRGAAKDYNARGSRREHWFRMVLRNGSWEYVSSDYLPKANYLASDRCATVYGEVYPGELVVSHDLGAQVDQMWIVEAHPEESTKPLKKVEFSKTRAGLKVVLPDGTELTVSDPRKK